MLWTWSSKCWANRRRLRPTRNSVTQPPDDLVDNMLAVLTYDRALATVKSSGSRSRRLCPSPFGGLRDRRHVSYSALGRSQCACRLVARSGHVPSRLSGHSTTEIHSRYVEDAADMAHVIRGEAGISFHLPARPGCAGSTAAGQQSARLMIRILTRKYLVTMPARFAVTRLSEHGQLVTDSERRFPLEPQPARAALRHRHGRGSYGNEMPIVDTHQHLWDLQIFRPPWLEDAPPVLATAIRHGGLPPGNAGSERRQGDLHGDRRRSASNNCRKPNM